MGEAVSLPVLHLDFETASASELRAVGTPAYAEHESTKIWLASYAFDDEDIETWFPDQPCPPRIRQHIEAGGIIAAHNSAFERMIIRYIAGPRHGWPVPRADQWRCTAAMAAAMSLPRALDKACWVMGCAAQKDADGAKTMMRMAKPREIVPYGHKKWADLFAGLARAGGSHPGLTKMSNGSIVVWWWSPELIARLDSYCQQDVRAERELEKKLRPLSPFEQRLFVLDAKINDRGLLVDHSTIRNCQEVVQKSSEWLNAEVGELTGGLKTTQRGALVSWLEAQGLSYAKPGKVTEAADAVPEEDEEPTIEALDKEALESMLARENLEPGVRRVLEIRLEAGKSAHTKLNGMVARANKDGRLRHNFLYCGAHTTRWSGQGVQLQNLQRPSGKYDLMPALDELVAGMSAEMIQCFFGPPLSIVGENMRGMLMAAPGKEFVTGDFANIEGRVNAWLNDETPKLDAFRAYDAGTGDDLYLIAAAGIYKQPISNFNKKSPERQIGKVAELACLGRDTHVVTDNGIKLLTRVTKEDRVWDGHEWVRHEGVVSRGRRRVLSFPGLDVTPDHQVKANGRWIKMNEVALNGSYLSQALETGLESLQSLSRYSSLRGAYTLSSYDALAERSLISCCRPTYYAAKARAVMYARKKSPVRTGRNFLSTTLSSPTTNTGAASLTVSPLRYSAVTTRKMPGFLTTAAAAFSFSPSGEPTKSPFCDMSSRYLDGTTPSSKWTASTPTKGTSLEIFGSSPEKPTKTTRDRFRISRDVLTPWRDVFDIAHAGPRNAFLVLTDLGPLLVHNCGYQGGVGAFSKMGKNYGLRLPEEQVKPIVKGWREAHPNIVKGWWAMQDAAFQAVNNPGVVAPCCGGKIQFVVHGAFLWAKMPSGGLLAYARPEVREVSRKVLTTDPDTGKVTEEIITKPAVTFWSVDSKTKKWKRAAGYGGIWCENFVQKISRDLLAEALLRIDARGWDLVLHSHDEAMIEAAIGSVPLKDFEAEMAIKPAWIGDCPITVEGWVGARYRK